jgi:ribosome maturation factor RimP
VKNRVVKIVERMAVPILNDMNYELADIEYKKEGKNWYLRIFIDKPGGVTIDDCQRFSEAISEELDATDPIPNSYILEVSSPGIERPLTKDTQFEKNLNKMVSVKLFETIQGLKQFNATLKGFDHENIILDSNEKGVLTIPRDKIALIKPVIEF